MIEVWVAVLHARNQLRSVMRRLFAVVFLLFLGMTLSVFAQSTYATYDVIGNTVTSFGVPMDGTDKDLAHDLDALKNGSDLVWRDAGDGYKQEEPGTMLWWLATQHDPDDTGANPAQTACVKNVDVHQAYIFHITHWTNPGGAAATPTLRSSAWYVYRRPRHPWEKTKTYDLVKADLAGAGDPLIYGASEALIVGIDVLDQPAKDDNGKVILDSAKKPTFVPSPGTLATTYSVTVTQGTPENLNGPRCTCFGSRRGIRDEAASARRRWQGSFFYICGGRVPTGDEEIAVRRVYNQRSREES